MDKGMIKENARKAINAMMNYKELDYRNSVVANIIANGKKEKLNEEWVRNALLQDAEDGFITYNQAVAIKDDYYKAIQMVAAQF